MGKKRKKKDTMEQDSSKVVMKRARKQVERPLSQDSVHVKKDRHNNVTPSIATEMLSMTKKTQRARKEETIRWHHLNLFFKYISHEIMK